MTQDNMKLEKQLIDTQYENIILKNRIKLCIKYINGVKFYATSNNEINKIYNDVRVLLFELKKILKGDDHEE